MLGLIKNAWQNPRVPSMPSASASHVQIKFWGTRGSIAVPGSATLRYGGNTTCVEVRADDEIILLDAGSGIRPLGIELVKEFGTQPIKLSLLVTHAHWDHIQGLPFFKPAYDPKNQIGIFGFDETGATFPQILAEPMKAPFFPIAMRELSAKIEIKKLSEMTFSVGKVQVRAAFVNHPGGCAGYRLNTSAGSVAFVPDHEPYEFFLHAPRANHLSPEQAKKTAANERAGLIEFFHGSDILILDAQYTDEEYQRHIGWGHSSVSSAVSLALDAEVHKLMLFHHDPNHDDQMVDKMLDHARSIVRKSGKSLEIDAAREGAEILLEAKVLV
jgi:phosphoribosyl 1,2-cyclic phosphodiesterase